MAEYIKREDAIKAYNEAVKELVEREMNEFDFGDSTWCIFNTTDLELIAQKITDIPSADVVERKCGEWVEVDDSVRPICSVCGMSCSGLHRNADYSVVPTWNFCPNCGADMRKPPTEEELGDCNICRFAGCSECDDCVNGSQWVREVKGVDYDYEEQERLYNELELFRKLFQKQIGGLFRKGQENEDK